MSKYICPQCKKNVGQVYDVKDQAICAKCYQQQAWDRQDKAQTRKVRVISNKKV